MSKHFYEVYIYLAVAQKCYFHSHIGLKNMASAHNQKPNNLLYILSKVALNTLNQNLKVDQDNYQIV
jgi:hypothetical protein